MRVCMFYMEKAVASFACAHIFIIHKMRKGYGTAAKGHNHCFQPAGGKQVANNNGNKAGYQQSQRQNAVMFFK
jgi:hypothetical protein